jgi:hypothetical protein
VLDTTQAATDTIDYVVTDQNGLTSTSTRTIIIPAANDNQATAHTAAMVGPRGADTYHVAITQSGYVPAWWEWEIYRNGRPLPIRLREQDFRSERTAKAAGAVALREFLEALSREQNL